MRSKEEAHDYRYFPDPDLLPLRLTAERVDEIASGLPELPDARCRRLQSTLGLDVEDARYLTRTRETADYFEQLVAEGVEAGEALNWVRGHLSARLKQAQLGIGEAPVPAAALAELAGLVDDGTISGKIAKEVFDRMWESGGRAADIVASEGLAQISDESAIEAVARSVLEAHPQKVKQYRGGKEGLLGFFVGQVMRQTGGRANPATVQEVLRRALGSGS